jgi:C1A family cysteine protease
LSEEYLLWSTLQYLKRHPAPTQGRAFDGEEPGDIGFSLMSVVQAAQWYGAALQAEMPNRLGGSYAQLQAPSEDLIERSRSRRLLRAARLGGRDNEARIEFIIKVLNAGWPVTIGTRWPSAYTLQQRPLVDRQTPLPDYAHAITLVGYLAKDRDIRNCVFIFRNSWGVRWGIAGHGMISRDFLLKHLRDAIVIDVDASI